MRVQLSLRGNESNPLLMHRGELADPEDHYAREMQKITSKRNKTDEDRHEIDRLSWLGSLYTNPEGDIVVMRTFNVWRTIQEAAKHNKMGRHIERALVFDAAIVPLEYPDSQLALDKLYETDGYVNRMMVRVGQSKVARVRPQFVSWSMTLTGDLDETELTYEDFEAIVHRAGRVVGLCDARKLGFGRFTAG